MFYICSRRKVRSVFVHPSNLMPPLRYIFIDFNAFFAAVEQLDNPGLLGKPVIVAPLESEHTSAIAVSYEARRYGVRRGTKITEARQRCPGVTICPARHDRYVAVHRQAMSEIERFVPIDKVFSIDEAAFRLGKSEATTGAAFALAAKVRRNIENNIGPALRVSIGVSETRLLAKLAAGLQKPDGFVTLTSEELPGRISTMPLTDIPGIGLGVFERLMRSGISSVDRLWRLSPKQARAIWGSVYGERFWYSFHGCEVDEPKTKRSMIGHSRVLMQEHETPEAARTVACALLLKGASRLRHYDLFARNLGLYARGWGEQAWEGNTRFDFSQDSYKFLSKLDSLWTEAMIYWRRQNYTCRFRQVAVFFYGFENSIVQADFFEGAQNRRQEEANSRLWKAIDKINSDITGKYAEGRGDTHGFSGPHRHIALASKAGLDLNYLGAKVAFSRVPTEAEFLY